MHSQIIERLKASGIFDQFRKECIADVDTKPAYINLHSRVVQSTEDYLKHVHWSSKLVRIGVREGMRKHIVESSYFEKGVDRIVNQTVDPKINTSFLPVIENAVYEFLGVQRPTGEEHKEEQEPEEDSKCWVQPMDIDPPQDSSEEVPNWKPIPEYSYEPEPVDVKPKVEMIEPKLQVKDDDDDQSSDGNLVISENPIPAEEKMEEEDDEEESPPFEVIGLTSPPHPFLGSSVPIDDIKNTRDSSNGDGQMSDFSNCFVKPELLSNDSSDVGEAEFSQSGTAEKKELIKSSSKESSSKERSSSSSSKKSSSVKDKERSSSSSKNRSSSSSSHSHSKSKSRHRDHSSSSKEKDKSSSDKYSNRDKDRNKKESSSSSKHASKSSSDSKYSRSSHSSSSRRHSSTSHSKDSRSTSDKNKTDEKSSSKYKDKDYKVSSSNKESSRSHSSYSKDQDKNKNSSSSSSRKSSSSRSGQDHKSRSSRTSSKYDKEKSDMPRYDDESNKVVKTEVKKEDLPSPVSTQAPAVDSPPSVHEQLSPDVNEAGLMTNPEHQNGLSPKMIRDHEESARDKWYNSNAAGSNSQDDVVSFSNSNLEPPTSRTIDDAENVSSASPISDREDSSNSCAYSPTIPSKPEDELDMHHQPVLTKSLDEPPAKRPKRVKGTEEKQGQTRRSRGELILSLQDLTTREDFITRRNYLSTLMDPFYDEQNIPVSPPKIQSNQSVTIDNCMLNDKMIKWLQQKGARVCLKK